MTIRAEVGVRTRWTLFLGTVVVPLLAMAVIYASDGVASLRVLAPCVGAWVVLGLRLILRGSQTLVDPPEQATLGQQLEQEIPA